MGSNKENVGYEEDEEEEEVFFGEVSEKEQRIASKFARRRTVLFTPDFRNDRKLMRYTLEPGKLGSLLEEGPGACVDSGTENVPNGNDVEMALEIVDGAEDGKPTDESIGISETDANDNKTACSDTNNSCGSNNQNPNLDVSSPDRSICPTNMNKSPEQCKEDENPDESVNELTEMIPRLGLSEESKAGQGDSCSGMSDPSSDDTTSCVQASPTASCCSDAPSVTPTDVMSPHQSGCDVLQSAEYMKEKIPDGIPSGETFAAMGEDKNHKTPDGSFCESSEPAAEPKPSKNLGRSEDELASETFQDKDILYTPSGKDKEECETPTIQFKKSDTTPAPESEHGKEEENSIFVTPAVSAKKKIVEDSNDETPTITFKKNNNPVTSAPRGPNTARIGFKRSSTSAFQVTPSRKETKPFPMFSVPDWQSPSPAFVFKEMNFSPTLKVTDVKQPSTTDVTSQPQFRDRQASFDFHEKELLAEEKSSHTQLFESSRPKVSNSSTFSTPVNRSLPSNK